jgi:hypothetical protein
MGLFLRFRSIPIPRSTDDADHSLLSRRCSSRRRAVVSSVRPAPGLVGVLVHVDHIEDIRELARHISIVAAAFLEPEVGSVAAGFAGQALHDPVGLGVKDSDGRTQEVGGDHILAIGAHRGLDRA